MKKNNLTESDTYSNPEYLLQKQMSQEKSTLLGTVAFTMNAGICEVSRIFFSFYVYVKLHKFEINYIETIT